VRAGRSSTCVSRSPSSWTARRLRPPPSSA
jgi:hypothetical protein